MASNEPTSRARPRATDVLRTNQLLLLISLGAVILIGALIAIAVGRWWVVLIGLLVHIVGTAILVALALRVAERYDQPSSAG